jgi:hypothetical protein
MGSFRGSIVHSPEICEKKLQGKISGSRGGSGIGEQRTNLTFTIRPYS